MSLESIRSGTVQDAVRSMAMTEEEQKDYRRAKRAAYKRKWYKSLSGERKKKIVETANRWVRENPEAHRAAVRRSGRKRYADPVKRRKMIDSSKRCYRNRQLKK